MNINKIFNEYNKLEYIDFSKFETCNIIHDFIIGFMWLNDINKIDKFIINKA